MYALYTFDFMRLLINKLNEVGSTKAATLMFSLGSFSLHSPRILKALEVQK